MPAANGCTSTSKTTSPTSTTRPAASPRPPPDSSHYPHENLLLDREMGHGVVVDGDGALAGLGLVSLASLEGPVLPRWVAADDRAVARRGAQMSGPVPQVRQIPRADDHRGLAAHGDLAVAYSERIASRDPVAGSTGAAADEGSVGRHQA